MRKRPPKPTRAQKSDGRAFQASNPNNGNWVTLREAEAETGIPVNTLRKWIRRVDLPSYLEADGDLALRMVDLDAVLIRAEELGREIVQPSEAQPNVSEPVTAAAEPVIADATTPDTMIVPVDAWNKMLNQLGNLHEAGQQLAEARERAAKAETEAKFLRAQIAGSRNDDVAGEPETIEEPVDAVPEPDDAHLPAAADESAPDSTTYWRYLTSGWRDRKRRRG